MGRVTVEIDSELWKRVRRYAFDNDITAQKLVEAGLRYIVEPPSTKALEEDKHYIEGQGIVGGVMAEEASKRTIGHTPRQFRPVPKPGAKK